MITRGRWASKSSAPSTRWCRPAGTCTSSCSPTVTTKTTSTPTTWLALWRTSKRYTQIYSFNLAFSSSLSRLKSLHRPVSTSPIEYFNPAHFRISIILTTSSSWLKFKCFFLIAIKQKAHFWKYIAEGNVGTQQHLRVTHWENQLLSAHWGLHKKLSQYVTCKHTEKSCFWYEIQIRYCSHFTRLSI